MIAATALAHIRSATIDDVGGILAIIEPLEEQGVLVRRSRERLESEIERFVVAEYDGHIIGCAALYAFPEDKLGELAALAVQPDFRREGYGEALLREIETRARKLKLAELFVLTTKTAHWFLERGFRVGAGRRPAAAEAGALQLPAQVAGLPQVNLGHIPMARTVNCVKLGKRSRRSRFPAVPRRTRQAHLRKRVQGSVAGVAQAPDDAGERESPEPGRRARAQVARRADGEALLRRRRGHAAGVRAAEADGRNSKAGDTAGGCGRHRPPPCRAIGGSGRGLSQGPGH